MNGIEKITDRITGDTGREIDELLKKANEEASAIERKYSDEAAALERDILERGTAASRERVLRLAGVADLEARKMVLGAKQEVLGLAFDKAMEDLLALPEEDYVKLLARLAADSVSTGSGELIFSPADRTRIGKKVVLEAIELVKTRAKNQEPDSKTKAAGDIEALGKKVAAAAAELIKPREDQGITLSAETRPLKGGMIVKYGDIEMNCSFEAIMRSIRDDVTKSVSDVLFTA